MIECEDVVQNVGKYLLNQLSDSRRVLIDEHVRHCASCEALVDRYEDLYLTDGGNPSGLGGLGSMGGIGEMGGLSGSFEMDQKDGELGEGSPSIFRSVFLGLLWALAIYLLNEFIVEH